MIKHCVFCVHRDERLQRDECIEVCLRGAGGLPERNYSLFEPVQAAWAKDSDRLWAALEWLLRENDARLMGHRGLEALFQELEVLLPPR
jgi:hypothetical protein